MYAGWKQSASGRSTGASRADKWGNGADDLSVSSDTAKQKLAVDKYGIDSDMEEGEFEKLYLELFQEEWKDEFEWKFQYSNEIQINPCTGKSGWFLTSTKRTNRRIKMRKITKKIVCIILMITVTFLY